jgi:D-alanyl-lipoteichoic acid acyltransferase DltB (MBOAT superfamily)
MNFGELRFWGYLFLGLAVIFTLRFFVRRLWPKQVIWYDKLALFSLGVYLLACVSWLTTLIWATVSIGSYLGLKVVLRLGPGKVVRAVSLTILILLQLTPLLYYKYANFVVNGVLGSQVDYLKDLVIPFGLSFYTFQKIAFVVDLLAYRERMPTFLNYLNFAGFFPQIVAGPIERKRDLLPQMEGFSFRWDRDNISEGIAWITVGLFFKLCLADNLQVFFTSYQADQDNPFVIWMANLLFGLRIYYDFAGYSLVAVGIARCLGVRLTLNFLSPYVATNIQEFWRRWHVTLSNWFRDYVYIPLGGARTRLWAVNLMVVFVVSGIWHGAGWNFIIWGGLHGTYIVGHRLWKGRFSFPAVVSWPVTMLGVYLAWMCFYELNSSRLWAKMGTVVNPWKYTSANFQSALALLAGRDAVVLISVLGLIGLTFLAELLSVRLKNDPYAYLRRTVVLCLLVVLTIALAPVNSNASFIYFAF